MWSQVTGYATKTNTSSNSGKLFEVGKWNANFPGTKAHNKNKTNQNDNLKHKLQDRCLYKYE